MPDSSSTIPESPASKSGRRIWLLMSAACLVPAILDATQTYFQAKLNGDPPRWQDVIFQGTEWLFLGALLPITYNLAQRVPLTPQTWRRALALHGAGALTLCVGWATLGVLLGYALGRYPAGNYLGWILTSIPWSVFMYFTVLGCVYAFAYFNEAREREASQARLSAQLAEAKLGALRMQLHPHFLFNSLNAIAVLVREHNTAGATRMLELLGDVLRQVLRSDQPHEIPLADELAFLEQYLAIEQVRFSDRLRVEWAIEDRARIGLVPGFVLQPLVENALKHGIAKRAEAGLIEIGARVVGEHLELSVRDDGGGMPSTTREGVGLWNTRERLRTLYGDQATMNIETTPGQGLRVVIRIPFRSGRS